MSNKKIYVILFLLLLIALGLLGFFWYLTSKANKGLVDNNKEQVLTTKESNESPETIVPEETITTSKQITQPLTEQEKELAQLLKLAGNFVERYGSYSNQSDFENLTDLKPFMTDSLRAWADNFMESKRKSLSENEPYYGITTKSLKTEALSFEETKAKIKVSTQRSEVVGVNTNEKIFLQDVYLEFEKINDLWLVNKISN